MNNPTIEQLLPLLFLLKQPAFCLSNTGIISANEAAKNLAPASEHALSDWLGDSAPIYDAWDHSGSMTLALTFGALSGSAVLYPLADGTLFLLTVISNEIGHMATTAQVLRQPLTDLVVAAQQLAYDLEELENVNLQQKAAAVTHPIYSLCRITCNLADMEMLQDGGYPVHFEKLEMREYLRSLQFELEDLCQAAGRTLIYELPKKTLPLHIDTILLQRALLHLLSNALIHSKPDSSIRIWTETTANAMLLRICSTCTSEDSDLLSSAFNRLDQRGKLPDPSWGLGLGIPITLAIARIMGGTLAVELRQHTATMTMSISRHPPAKDHMQMPYYDYTGGMRQTLVELSGSLPDSCYNSMAL